MGQQPKALVLLTGLDTREDISMEDQMSSYDKNYKDLENIIIREIEDRNRFTYKDKEIIKNTIGFQVALVSALWARLFILIWTHSPLRVFQLKNSIYQKARLSPTQENPHDL